MTEPPRPRDRPATDRPTADRAPQARRPEAPDPEAHAPGAPRPASRKGGEDKGRRRENAEPDTALSERTAARRAAFARGLAAEARAAGLLEALGFTLLAQRVRTKAGEIDLIARQGDLVVFCEVKERAGRDEAAYAILPRQQRRIAAAAGAWLADHPECALLNARFDAILVTSSGALEHLPGAFEAEG